TYASGAEVDSIIRFDVLTLVMTEAVVTSHAASDPPILVPETGIKITSLVHASMFHDSDSMEIVRADVAGPSYSVKQDLLMGSQELNAETLHQVFVPQWNVLNDDLLDDYDVSREFIDHLAPPILFSQICEMDYHHLFMEFNVGTARQACLNAEVRMQTEYCLSERSRLESECKKQADLLKARDDEVKNLKDQLLLKETEAAEAARLRAQVSAAEATKKVHADEIDALKQRNVALDNEKDSLDGKVTELRSSVSTKDLELKDLNVVVSSLKSQNDGLVDQVHALETTCSSLRDKVSGYERLKEQIEEFQDAQMNIVNDKVAKLDADLPEMALHLEEKFYPHLFTTIFGRRWLLTRGIKLAVVKCLNSLVYLTALGSAISRAIENGMQDGLSAGINHGKADQVVLGETSLSFALSVAHSRVDVWVPLVDPLSAENLIGTSSTFGHVSAAVVTTTALSTTFSFASSIPPITTDDYEIVGMDGQDDAQGSVLGSFADSTGFVTPFVCWIEDYPLSDGLKMPSHIGSYDGKGDPDNFLHLFEGAIRMKKWLMPVACHMFTYTLKDSARIWWNSQKTGSILNYEDLKAKFRSHFNQQKKFTKTHLAVHNIKQREGKSTRAFVTRYTNDTLQILGLHEEQRISGFVHGLRTRSLVKHLSTDLPSTYKGLMEKIYTWIEAREVATNGTPNDRREIFKKVKEVFLGEQPRAEKQR
ncbi:gypsy type transposase, partial [Tanacetum coccineum]